MTLGRKDYKDFQEQTVPDGIDGAPGLQGDPGPQGIQGIQGIPGVDGLDGTEVSGSIGSIFFAGSDGFITENNNQLFWDNTNSRLELNYFSFRLRGYKWRHPDKNTRLAIIQTILCL